MYLLKKKKKMTSFQIASGQGREPAFVAKCKEHGRVTASGQKSGSEHSRRAFQHSSAPTKVDGSSLFLLSPIYSSVVCSQQKDILGRCLKDEWRAIIPLGFLIPEAFREVYKKYTQRVPLNTIIIIDWFFILLISKLF